MAESFLKLWLFFSLFPFVSSYFLGRYTKFLPNFFKNLLIFLENSISKTSKNFSSFSKNFFYIYTPIVQNHHRSRRNTTDHSELIRIAPSQITQNWLRLCRTITYYAKQSQITQNRLSTITDHAKPDHITQNHHKSRRTSLYHTKRS